MSRSSRVPYHQNVYDLLQIEPGDSPEALRMIAEHEAKHGTLPASVKEWYLVPNVVPLTAARRSSATRSGTFWYEFSNQDWAESLDQVLAAIANPRKASRRRFAQIMSENQGVVRWYLLLTKADDPPVWCDNEEEDDPRAWSEFASSLSTFTFEWFAQYYVQDFTPISKYQYGRPKGEDPASVKPFVNGLWLRAPDEPFQPPVIDFLIDKFGEPKVTPRPGNVSTFTFRPQGGTIRVTADEPTLSRGLSAWWIHADTPKRLEDFARLLMPWGKLSDTLRADTNSAREVLTRVHGK
jgi:hypothetical protein